MSSFEKKKKHAIWTTLLMHNFEAIFPTSRFRIG